ncbi:MAG TPA: peptidase S41, partial [Thermoanaerobaculia bacterium]
MRFTRLFLCAFAALAAALSAAAQDGAAGPSTTDTRLLARPALNGERIAFVYGGDLWVANAAGGTAIRITSGGNVTTSPSFGASLVESSPVFSPDGRWIAFSANQDGNNDVYVVPSSGGVPRRLTWHPGSDLVQGFTPDGKSVLFSSPRAVYTTRYNNLYLVPIGGGVEEKLPIPNATRASYSPDGAQIAYNPLSHHFLQWKRYRGGAVSRILLFQNASYAVEQIPQPNGGCNDADPMWVGGTVFFRSDRDGEFNLYSYDVQSKAVRRLTNHQDYPVLSASAQGDRIA